MTQGDYIDKIKSAFESDGAIVCTECEVEVGLADCESIDDALVKWDNHVDEVHR